MSVNGITSGVSNSYPSTSFSRETASKTETKRLRIPALYMSHPHLLRTTAPK